MRLEELLALVEGLDPDSARPIYTASDGSVFSVLRPSRPPRGLKHRYDPRKNVQIWVKEPGRSDFMPNHLRVFLDLEFACRTVPAARRDLAISFDAVFRGEDPKGVMVRLGALPLHDPLRPVDYDLLLHQLFIAEQAIGYPRTSRYDPPYLFLQGWVRAVLSGTWEIDRLLKVAERFPPGDEFTRFDNRKHADFLEQAPQLWYFSSGDTPGARPATGRR